MIKAFADNNGQYDFSLDRSAFTANLANVHKSWIVVSQIERKVAVCFQTGVVGAVSINVSRCESIGLP
jgi:hypothetical protein